MELKELIEVLSFEKGKLHEVVNFLPIMSCPYWDTRIDRYLCELIFSFPKLENLSY